MNRWSFFFILIFLAVPQLGIDLYLPSTPAMTIAFHTSATVIQLTLAVYTISIAVSQLLYGFISDSVGRKPVILFACLVFIIGSIICLIAQTIDLLLVGRLFQGMGMGFGGALGRAILRDLCQDKKLLAKMISYQSMTWSTVPLVAPIIGGYIQHFFDWRINFYVLFVMGLILFILVFFKFDETRPKSMCVPLRLSNILRLYWSLIRRFEVFGYMLIIAIQFGGLLTIIQLTPFIFQNQLGYSSAVYGWLIFVVGFGSFIGSLLNRFVSQRYALNHIIYFAIIGAFLVSIVMNLLAIEWFNLYVILIPILLIRFLGGLTYSNCVIQGMHQASESAGSMSALFGTTAVGGGSLISFSVAHLPHDNHFMLSGTLSVQLFVSLGLMTLLFLRKRQKEKKNG